MGTNQVEDKGWGRLGMAAASVALVVVTLAALSPVAAASSGTAVREPQYGFSFSLPSAWKLVPLDGSDITALLNAATHNDPSLASALDSQITSEASKGMKVFAIGPVSGSVAPNVNVIVSAPGGDIPTGNEFAREAVAEAKIEMSQLGAGHPKAFVVKNRLGDVAEATYTLSLRGTHEAGEQLFAHHGANLDIVTVTTSTSASTKAIANHVVNSWHWEQAG
jgi:hypothetical protein